MYAGGATGGIWKTTDFLTTSPTGPTWVPLTNFGSDFSVNIGSIAIIPRNNDPSQSIIFVATGEGDALGDPTQSKAVRGVGFLRSMDGGQTWTLLDSTDNTQPFAAAAGAPQRDHLFALRAGARRCSRWRSTPRRSRTAITSSMRPCPTSTARARPAASGGAWTAARPGAFLAPRLVTTYPTWPARRPTFCSTRPAARGRPDGNIQTVYAAIEGQGIFRSPNRAQNWSQMVGGIGDPLIQNADNPQPQPVSVTPTALTPNGGQRPDRLGSSGAGAQPAAVVAGEQALPGLAVRGRLGSRHGEFQRRAPGRHARRPVRHQGLWPELDAGSTSRRHVWRSHERPHPRPWSTRRGTRR